MSLVLSGPHGTITVPLEKADTSGWTLVSIKNDWATVF